MDKKKNLNRLLLTWALFATASVLSDSFVNIYLWRLKSSYTPIIIYMLSCFAVVPFIFYLCGYIGMRIDRVTIYNIGIFWYAAFYFTGLIFREHIADHVIIWGVMKGLAMGFYWFGYHILTFDYTSPENRDFYYSNATIISGASSLLGPLIAGFIITHFTNFSGYYIIFTSSAVLFAFAAVLALAMKSKPLKKPYKIEDLIFTKNVKWRDTMIAYLFLSGKDTVSMLLIGVLVFKSTGSEFTLGKYAMLTAAATITTSFLLGKFSKPDTRPRLVLTGAIITFAAAFLLVYKISFPTLLIFGILGAIADWMVRIPISAHALDVISLDASANERKMEYIVARDVPIAVGRIVMLVVFVLFLQYMPVNAIKAIILLVAAFPFGVYWAMYGRQFKIRNSQFTIHN